VIQILVSKSRHVHRLYFNIKTFLLVLHDLIEIVTPGLLSYILSVVRLCGGSDEGGGETV